MSIWSMSSSKVIWWEQGLPAVSWAAMARSSGVEGCGVDVVVAGGVVAAGCEVVAAGSRVWKRWSQGQAPCRPVSHLTHRSR